MSLPYRLAQWNLCLLLALFAGCGEQSVAVPKAAVKSPKKHETAAEKSEQPPPAATEVKETSQTPENPPQTAENPPAKDPSNEGAEKAAEKPVVKSKTPDPPGMVRLSPVYDVWLDPKHNRVAMLGYVCLRQGQLEMLVTLKGTKEHEAVVAVDTKAFIVHAALLGLHAEAKHPVQFRPKYAPAEGTEIEVQFEWTAPDGKKHLVRAQDWVRQIRTQREMEQPFVFGGSGFYRDENDGREHYLAEEGDFICVSNFPTAMLDVPVESSQSADGLMFEAFTERLPPAKTPVMVYLTPKLPANKASEKKTEKAAGDG